ncbi:hypothetical protein DAMA08_021540 [Martiniozyma asiatica (nom. inval.)]|nr:hypothetical protein DAMA08_021540 [Martiniozyma asiatica]
MEKINSNIQTSEVDSSSSSISATVLEDYDADFNIDQSGLLTFKSDSSLRPKNWPTKLKLIYTISYSFVTFAAQFNSTTMSSEYFIEKMHENFNIGREVSLIATSLYILGIAFGPMIFAPMSEVYGRKIGVLIPFFITCLFTFISSISYNVSGIMISRFLGGFFAGAPIVSAGGVLADLWNPSQRGVAFALYATFVSAGASFGPTISSLLIHSNDNLNSWRIPQWFAGLMGMALFIVLYILTKETYEPSLLKWKAIEERTSTQKWHIHAELETSRLHWKQLVTDHVYRPFYMLTIPIVFTMALFASYVYGVFYLTLTNVAVAFNLTRGWEGTVATLPCIALFVGINIGCLANMLWALRYRKIIEKNNGRAIPEQRFPIMMLLGWCMPAGIFIFGWTSSPNIHWVVPCLGVVILGIGFITTFQGCINYMVDTYQTYAASAIAANTFMRSVFAAGFPLFAHQLFTNLGVQWGASIIGFIALGMIPIPFVFYIFGQQIREHGTAKLSG